jgi:hypothetical protein
MVLMVVEESRLAKVKEGKKKAPVSRKFLHLSQHLLGVFVYDPRSLPGVVLRYREVLTESTSTDGGKTES